MKKITKTQIEVNMDPSLEELREYVDRSIKDQQYMDALNYLNSLLEIDEKDYYYTFRAIILTLYAINDNGMNLEEVYNAFADIERALKINPTTHNLYIKFWLLDIARKVYIHYPCPITECQIDYPSEQFSYRSYPFCFKNYKDWEAFNLKHMLPENDLLSSTEYINILDVLISQYPKAKFYESRAKEYLKLSEQQDDSKTKANMLNSALLDILSSIKIEPSFERYKIKTDIEIASQMYDQALQSLKMEYKDNTNQEEYLKKKYDILKKAGRYETCFELLEEWYDFTENKGSVLDLMFLLYNDLKAYHEAIVVLDKMISISQPSVVNPELRLACSAFDLSYARKLDILLQIKDYESFARLVYDCFHRGLRMATTYYLHKLMEKDQPQVILKYFKSGVKDSPIIMWFVACAYSAIKENTKASKLIRTIDYNELSENLEGRFDIVNAEANFFIFQLDKSDMLELLVSSMRPSGMSPLLFFELIVNLLFTRASDTASDSIKNKELIKCTDNPVYNSDDIQWGLPKYQKYLRLVENLRQDQNGLNSQMKDIEAKLALIRSIDYSSLEPVLVVKELIAVIERSLIKSKDEMHLESIHQARIEERNRIIANISHSIKNMLKAVIGPLQTLREEIPEKAAIIDNAIKGANLIREIVNAINLSFKTTMDELNWDVLNPGRDSMSLQDMIADSLIYSIGNMFDFRYFPMYAENYFPRSLDKTDFESITRDWNQAQSSIDLVKDYCDRHLFKLELELDDSRDYHVGNEKSSAIKLMILFQEIIFNAVKYTSFIPFEERTVQISLTRHDDNLRLIVRNSYSDKVRAKTTGVGKLVIENFAKVLGCEPRIKTENNSYSIEMEFADIWRKHAEDSVH